MNHGMDDILKDVTDWPRRLEAIREILLANLVMTAEIPAPTFSEEARRNFMLQRFAEAGLDNASSDETGNALGILPGRTGEANILVVAHLDTIFDAQTDYAVTAMPDRLIGPGVADNSAGAAIVMSLPRILETLGLAFDANLILMGSARGLGRGNLEGLRFFLANQQLPLRAAICLEGAQLGRLNFTSLGMLSAEIHCRVPEEYDWTRFGASGAIVILHEVMGRILGIPVPRKPRTTIILGSMQGGTSYNRVATSAELRFEVRSEDDAQVSAIEESIRRIVDEVAGVTRAEVTLDIVARSRSGGLTFDHPLVQRAQAVMAALAIKPGIAPSTAELSALIGCNVPAVTIGLSTAEQLRLPGETLMLEPLNRGLAQLAGLLTAIDRGCCDE